MEKENEQTVDAIAAANLDDDVAHPFYALLTEEDERLIEANFSDFDWKISDAAALEKRLYGELLALEAANVQAIIQSEDPVLGVLSQIKRAMVELDIIDDWLGVYSEKLNDMGKDIHSIETKNKDLQIVTRNQRSLLSELDKLMENLSVSEKIVDVLASGSLETVSGVNQLNSAAKNLQQILQTRFDEGLQNIAAVTERMSTFSQLGNAFSERLHSYLKEFITGQTEAMLSDKNRFSKKGDLKLSNHETIQNKLVYYRGLTEWLKEMENRKAFDLEQFYVKNLNKVYKKDVSSFIDVLKAYGIAKRTTTEDLEYVFQPPSTTLTPLANAAALKGVRTTGLMRPLGGGTSKLSATGLRGSGTTAGHNSTETDREGSSYELNNEDRMNPDTALSYTFTLLIPILLREQYFLLDFFHLGGTKFRAANPNAGVATNTVFVPDRELLKDVKVQNKLSELMGVLFEGMQAEFLTLIESIIKYDNTYAIAMIVRIEEFLKENEGLSMFLNNMLDALQQKLQSIFESFLEEQAKLILDSKVSSKKRHGILPFIRTYPLFVERMETLLRGSENRARSLVNTAYEKLAKVVFSTLEAVANESEPDDDKGQLNANIITLENSHHLYSEIRVRRVPCLELYSRQAKSNYDRHLGEYVKVVIHRPLGKLLEFFDGIDSLLRTGLPEEVGFHLDYNKSALKKVIAAYPSKEIRKGLDTLYKRVQKHFCTEEGLLQVVWRDIQQAFIDKHAHFEDLIAKCYPEVSIHLQFTIQDLLSYFSEIAKSH